MLLIRKILILFLTISITSTTLHGSGNQIKDKEHFNVDFACGWNGYYRPMEWIPVEIGISTILEEPFGGSLVISARQDEMNTLNISSEFVVVRDSPFYVPLVTKLAFAADKCHVRLVDQHGRQQWSYDYPLRDYSGRNPLMKPVNDRDILIGFTGQSANFGLSRLPEQSVCQSRNNINGNVYFAAKQTRMVPWDWTGFASLDLFVLYNPSWDTFDEHQLKAMAQWVHNGGKLLLVLGSQPFSKDNPLSTILPFEINQTKQVTIPAEILQQWGLPTDESEVVACQPIELRSQGQHQNIHREYVGNDCMAAVCNIGFGRVGVLAFDPQNLRNEHRNNSARFWVSIIKKIMDDTDSSRNVPAGFSPGDFSRRIVFSPDPKSSINAGNNINQDRNLYNIGLAQAANNAILSFLYNIAQMRPLSIWWVILLLGALAVLLGPADYIILKIKDRLPWTWLTCTFWIVLFSVGAYYGANILRAGSLQLREVSVLDGIENGQWAWSTSHCALFAPKSADYKLEGLKNNQWWSSIAYSQSRMFTNNRTGMDTKIYCRQQDGGNLPYSLPVNIWTIQSLLNESPIEKVPFSAEIQTLGDQLTLKINNESGTLIQSGYVLLANNRGIRFGTIAGNKSQVISGKTVFINNWDEFEKGRSSMLMGGGENHFNNEDAFYAQGTLQRTLAIKSYLQQGAAVVCVVYNQPPVSFSIKNRASENSHIQLARLVVFPKSNYEVKGND